MPTSMLEDMPGQPAVRLSLHSPTANAWAASFVRHVHGVLEREGHTEARRLLARVCLVTQRQFDAHRPAPVDAQTATALGVCTLMLTTYRELMTSQEPTVAAFDLVRSGFEHAYQAFIQNICKPLLLNAHRSPQTLAGMNFRTWSEALCGQDAHGRELTRADHAFGYQHFFEVCGVPQLAQIIHRADQAWIEAVAAFGRAQPAGARCRTRASDRVGETGFVPFHFAPGRGRAAVRQDEVLELQITMPTDRRGSASASDRRRNWDGIDRRRSARRQEDDERRWM